MLDEQVPFRAILALVRALRAVSGVIVLCAAAGTAQAQDVAVAGAQFERGLAEMQAGRYETGCPALAESYRLDPRPGTLFTLAECHAKWGKLATAIQYYEEYLSRFERMTVDQKAGQRGREKIAAQQRDALRENVPKLTLRFATEPPRGTTVERDGVELGAPSLNVPLPTDPGDHVVTVKGPGGKKREYHITLAPGEQRDQVLEVEQSSEAPRPPPPPPAPAASSDGASLRTWGYVAGGVGVVGLAVGGIMGAVVLGKKSTIDAHCVGNACDAEGKKAGDSAKSAAAISTVGFVVGTAALATGIVLLVVAPSSKSTAGKIRPQVDWVGSAPVAGVGGAF
jgi:hypothetical protein